MLTLQSDIHGNHLLRTLPALEWQAIATDLQLVHLCAGQLLCDSGNRILHVYFPTTAVITMLHTMENGSCVEVAAIGCEGMTGLPVLTGGNTMPTRVEVQHAGAAYRVSGSALRGHFARSDALQRIALLYLQVLLTQMAQTAACNRRHSVRQQLCRWLLIQADRRPSDEMNVTQQMIADILGVRREGVTDALGMLQDSRFVQTTRGRIKVLDRAAIEARSCECYGIVKRELARMLPWDRRTEAPSQETLRS
ncbi:Crp/Fnr family transcriptional regulator [Caballeronia sp. GAFFF1]|uniref:Crp/Fnr family transcriptional regulator n=1 Tax=Caballeronia sp. GAFFF1 TaxID=2921779 RepID=UPI002028CC94|nr:Crp/Fnr family transcriptional regulator [Caballeronia sp. GAFFF1]